MNADSEVFPYIPAITFPSPETAKAAERLFNALNLWRNTVFADTNPVEPTRYEIEAREQALRSAWEAFCNSLSVVTQT
jgi:hypothetical protein